LILFRGHDNNGPARFARSIIERLEDGNAESGALADSTNP